MSVYLDYNATTPLREVARQAMLDVMDLVGNASSVHKNGRDVRAQMERARKSVADTLSVGPDQVIFTSGATEANNTVIKNYTGPVIVAATEHASVLQLRDDCMICPVDGNGVIKLDELRDMLGQSFSPPMVSVMMVNNETGVIQPIAEIAKLVRQHGGVFHCDAVQALGKVDVSGLMQMVDVASISGHKVGGPQGIGAIVYNKSFPLKPLLHGGGQERRWRGGTENVLGAVGFGAALQSVSISELSDIKSLRDHIENEILAVCPEAMIVGEKADRVSNTCNVVMPGVRSETQVMGFDLAGIAVSAGAACSSGKVQTSHVLAAMGLSEEQQQCSLRASMGWKTTLADAKSFVGEWKSIYKRCGNSS